MHVAPGSCLHSNAGYNSAELQTSDPVTKSWQKKGKLWDSVLHFLIIKKKKLPKPYLKKKRKKNLYYGDKAQRSCALRLHFHQYFIWIIAEMKMRHPGAALLLSRELVCIIKAVLNVFPEPFLMSEEKPKSFSFQSRNMRTCHLSAEKKTVR